MNVVDAGQMRAVGAGARDQIGMAVDQQRRAFVLHDRAQRLGAVDQRALVGVGKAQQHGGDVAGGQAPRPAARRKPCASATGGVTR